MTEESEAEGNLRLNAVATLLLIVDDEGVSNDVAGEDVDGGEDHDIDAGDCDVDNLFLSTAEDKLQR